MSPESDKAPQEILVAPDRGTPVQIEVKRGAPVQFTPALLKEAVQVEPVAGEPVTLHRATQVPAAPETPSRDPVEVVVIPDHPPRV
jgi:hypothetical protein